MTTFRYDGAACTVKSFSSESYKWVQTRPVAVPAPLKWSVTLRRTTMQPAIYNDL